MFIKIEQKIPNFLINLKQDVLIFKSFGLKKRKSYLKITAYKSSVL